MADTPHRPRDAYAQLLSLAVHEFRTPASVVGGYLRMLQSGVGGALSDAQRKMIDEAEKVVRAHRRRSSASSATSASSTAGRPFFNESDFDLFQLVDEVASDMHEAEDREVHLRAARSGRWRADDGRSDRLASAFSVFLRAVLREQPSATTVVVDRRLEGDSETARAVILIARERSRTADIRRCPGPVRRAARRAWASGCPWPAVSSSGTAAVSGRRAGRGRGRRIAPAFVVSLPLRPTGVKPLKKPYVAIVDDDSGFANYLRTFLSLRGYETRAYSRGDEMLAAVKNGDPPDVVLLDVMMPGHERHRDAQGASRPPRPTCRSSCCRGASRPRPSSKPCASARPTTSSSRTIPTGSARSRSIRRSRAPSRRRGWSRRSPSCAAS